MNILHLGSSPHDVCTLPDAELAVQLRTTAHLLEQFHFKASLPAAGRLALTLLLLWLSRDTLAAVNMEAYGGWGALFILVMCLAGPWYLFRTQLKAWRDEQLTVIQLLKTRRAHLLAEQAARDMKRPPRFQRWLDQYR